MPDDMSPSTEHDEAAVLANKMLDRINADPDDDLCVLARHFPRSLERVEELAAERGALLQDAKRYRWLRGCMWWRTDPFAQDVGNMHTGYWQTKLFKQEHNHANLDAAVDAALSATGATP